MILRKPGKAQPALTTTFADLIDALATIAGPVRQDKGQSHER